MLLKTPETIYLPQIKFSRANLMFDLTIYDLRPTLFHSTNSTRTLPQYNLTLSFPIHSQQSIPT